MDCPKCYLYTSGKASVGNVLFLLGPMPKMSKIQFEVHMSRHARNYSFRINLCSVNDNLHTISICCFLAAFRRPFLNQYQSLKKKIDVTVQHSGFRHFMSRGYEIKYMRI